MRDWLSDSAEHLLPRSQPIPLEKVSQSDDSDFSYTVPSALDLLAEMDGGQNLTERDASHNQAIRALLQAEERKLLADRFSAELRARPAFDSLNGVIADFLTGPWAQVMAQEKLVQTDGSADAGKAPFSALVSDLIWSLDPELPAQHRQRLLRAIPRILATLREGLVFIDYPLAQSKPFFDELMAIHQAALKQEHKPPAEALPVAPEPHGQPDFQASEPWLTPSEARQSGFLDVEVGVQAPDLPDAATSPAATPADLVSQLTVGTWVELMRDGTTLRAQLTWASSHNTLFMFSSAGGRTHSMTRRALLRLQQLGALRGVNTSGVADHAFDTAARKPMADPGR